MNSYLFICFSGTDKITGIPDRQECGSSDCFSAKLSCIDDKSTFNGLTISPFTTCAAVFFNISNITITNAETTNTN